MNLRILRYYTMSHPFNRSEKVVFSNRDNALQTAGQVREVSRNEKTGSPRLLKVHIKGEGSKEENESERIELYEKNRLAKERSDFDRAKTVEIMRFTRSLLIAYLLYLAPESFWNPIVSLFNLIAHGLSDYARWCIIIFFPLKGFIRTFGTLFYLRGKISLGIPGQWHRINEGARALDIFDKPKESPRENLDRRIDDFLGNLKKEASVGKETCDQLETLLKGNGAEDPYSDPRSLDRSLKEIIRREENGPLWAEMIKLDQLRDEILYGRATGQDSGIPLFHFHPGAPAPSFPDHPPMELRFRSYGAQAENLRAFNALPLVNRKKEELEKLAIPLKEAGTNKERISLLADMTAALEILRDEAGRFHMGDNMLIPHEKGNDPALYYHGLFNICGSALCELEKGYGRRGWGISLIRSDRAGKRRVAKMFDQVDLYLYGRLKNRWRNKRRLFPAFWGKNLRRGFVLAFATLFLVGSLFGFYTAGPGRRVILKEMKIGYRDKFINWETAILESERTRPGWHLPRPLASHSIINGESREISVYMIMGEHKSRNPLSRLLTALSGQLGTRFDVVELQIRYEPNNAEVWSRYDGDGKGERRLLRDLSELSEEWRNVQGSVESSISSREFDRYFRELADRGILEEYLKRSFSQTTFSTNLYYGSLNERFSAGINAVLNKFDNVLAEMKGDLQAEQDDIARMEKSLETSSRIVRDLKEEIEEQVRLEYSLLRSDPALLNELVSRPYRNARKLKDFETLWINLANYVQYLYRQNELLKVLSDGYVDMALIEEARKIYPIHLKLAEYIRGNSLIGELIEIKSIDFRGKIIGLTEFTQYQEKWKDTI